MAIKNFFEKIVYLYKASVDTIQQFGLGYFLRFGSGQLRKQKLDIFKPNEDYDEILSKKPVDKKTQYKIWKEQQEKVPSDFSEDDTSKSNLKDSISIVLFVNNTMLIEFLRFDLLASFSEKSDGCSSCCCFQILY